LTFWGKLAETIVRWYVLSLVLYAVVWILWVLSGSNPYDMVINMIAALSGVIIIIILIEILRRKTKVND
jgi:hypothetical protein